MCIEHGHVTSRPIVIRSWMAAIPIVSIGKRGSLQLIFLLLVFTLPFIVMDTHKGTIVLSDYARNINGPEKKRYMAKISEIGVDPYTLLNGSTDVRTWPNITYMDIVNYLVFGKSAYSSEQFKAYKSMESYKNYRAGYVKNISATNIEDHCVINSRVTHSQKIRLTPTKTWVICLKNGEIISAHCDCVAGLGEVCSHVGSALFAVEEMVRTYLEGPTVTDSFAYWRVPSGSLGEMSSVKEINYEADWNLGPTEGASTPEPFIPESTSEENQNFLEKLKNAGEVPAIFAVTEPYCDLFKKEQGLAEILFRHENQDKKLEELIEMGEKLCLLVDTDAIEKLTIGQSKNKEWHSVRIGRITASKCKAVCHTKVEKPSISLIKSICYPSSFTSARTSYGCEHEKKAINEYSTYMQSKHNKFRIWETGILLNNDYPCCGASPDSMVICECCGKGVLEVKCPFCARDGNLVEEILALKTSFLSYSGDGVVPYQLSKKHAYFYQVQMQMAMANVQYCDFFVWNDKQFLLERIYFNKNFWINTYAKLKEFHQKVIIPELLGKYYSQRS